MNRLLFLGALLLFLFARAMPVEAASDFGAYYTALSTGQDWEAHSRTGKFADVVVQLASGKLVFWRGNSYLPYWQTDKGQWNLTEIIPRTGDGVQPMPDRTNTYSHADIIQNSPDSIIVHWRYLSSFTAGNPHGDVQRDHFVDELFTITPDGNVHRVIRKCAQRIDDWNDPLNQTEQVLKLDAAGITQVSRTEPRHSAVSDRVEGNPVSKQAVVPPSIWFRFDEGTGDDTIEEITRSSVQVNGPKTLWKKGVSGTALEFDGYRSAVVLPSSKAPKLSSGNLTLEAWIAVGAYPWNWAPIVQQGDNQGYFLGVDSHGYPGLMMQVGNTWQQLTVPGAKPYTDPNHLDLFHWHHLAGTFSKQDGIMRLYLDGREIANKSVGPDGLRTADADVRIGKAGILRKPTEDTRASLPSDFGFDGLIDEVRVYDAALDAAQVSTSFNNANPGQQIVLSPDLQKRRLPTLDTGGKFGAVYTHLNYYQTWDNLWSVGRYSDVVVGFDQSPMKLVFWRGESYIPTMVNESNQWYMNEFCETGFTRDAPGDCEPMSDKPCLDSHVRIIESSPARAVIQWRYRLANPDHHMAFYNPQTGWGDIADWYYYVYPDGVISKQMRCYSSKPDVWHEWDEQIIVLGEGQHPESVIKKTPVMTLVDPDGNASDYDWNPNPPKPKYAGKILQMIHLTGHYSPFTIQNFNKGDIYGGERTWYSVFPSWNHWPTSQINSSGRNASFTDRASHASLSHLFWPVSDHRTGDIPYQEKTLMEGMSDQPASSLTPLAKSWLHAPGVSLCSGGTSLGYAQAERAYCFQYASHPLAFTIDASATNPIHNLCMVIKNWPSRTSRADLLMNEMAQTPGPDFRQGTTIDTDGTDTLVIWIGLQSEKPVTFKLSSH